MSRAQFHRRQVLSRYGKTILIVNAALGAALRTAAGGAARTGALLGVLLALAIGPAGASEPTRQLLVLGDSLTAGYGLPREQSFPAQLEQALRAAGHDVAVVNAGVSGDTTSGGLARLTWTLDGFPGGEPDAAIVELGANDALRGLDPEPIFANLSAILAEFEQRRIPVLLTGMLAPPNLGKEYAEAFNAIYPRLAEEHDVLFYPFFLEGVAGTPQLNQSDGIHPNAQGVARIVANILPSVKDLLRQARQAEQLGISER